ncbi:DUF494 domain-containing protein [Aquabacterium soli]|uniref:Protein Smg homolog n=1 Tax=Aquabacterium soli TaxID=2493092 RepID=A0A3R8T2X5_9BURK|nr:DUF494 domain-containing protein [Aquabacterium soli]RRS04862.1 DUF494 domain-containing protein [Aquabacterium soli]
MFDVLVYLYEHYWRPDAFPEADLLTRKLSAVGFEAEEISEALTWLEGLTQAASTEPIQPQSSSVRIYSSVELEHMGPEALGFLQFLESAGVLSASQREMILDRMLAISGAPVSLEDLKVIVLMVFWSMGEEPDALILDELFAEEGERVLH